jgi:hypothetical protein
MANPGFSEKIPTQCINDPNPIERLEVPLSIGATGNWSAFKISIHILSPLNLSMLRPYDMRSVAEFVLSIFQVRAFPGPLHQVVCR